MADSKTYAVLVGDLIDSRRLTPGQLDQALSTLGAAAEDLGYTTFTRFRGDGWQVLVPEPAKAVTAMVFMRARLKASGPSLDTRIGLGIGAVATTGTKDLSDATGEAFFLAGDALESADKVHFVVAGKGMGDWQSTVVRLLDEIVSDWTSAQAEAFALYLSGTARHADIAQALNISRQAAQKRLAGAKYLSVEGALRVFEKEFGAAP